MLIVFNSDITVTKKTKRIRFRKKKSEIEIHQIAGANGTEAINDVDENETGDDVAG